MREKEEEGCTDDPEPTESADAAVPEPERQPRVRHDEFFRMVFSHAGCARWLLQRHLPTETAALLEWSTLEALPADTPNPSLENHQSDLLMRVQMRASAAPLRIYMLFEHKSRAERMLSLQLNNYVARLWESQGVRPEPVIAVAVRQLAKPEPILQPVEVMNLSDAERSELAALQPSFTIIAVDLIGDVGRPPSAEDHAALAGWLGCLLLSRLHRTGVDQEAFLRELSQYRNVLAAVYRSESGPQRMQAVLSYMMSWYRGEPDRLARMIQETFPMSEPEMQEMIGTVEEQLYQKAKERARAEVHEDLAAVRQDLAEAREDLAKARREMETCRREAVESVVAAKAEAEGARRRQLDLLRHFLTARFGALTPDVEQRLAEADDKTRDAWLRRAGDSAQLTLDEWLA